MNKTKSIIFSVILWPFFFFPNHVRAVQAGFTHNKHWFLRLSKVKHASLLQLNVNFFFFFSSPPFVLRLNLIQHFLVSCLIFWWNLTPIVILASFSFNYDLTRQKKAQNPAKTKVRSCLFFSLFSLFFFLYLLPAAVCALVCWPTLCSLPLLQVRTLLLLDWNPITAAAWAAAFALAYFQFCAAECSFVFTPVFLSCCR